MNNPRVGVVIASVGRPQDLNECLRSVKCQQPAAEEIVVVAQTADRETIEVATERGARVVLVEKPGLALAIETGIRGSTADVLAFIDDDARALPGWLRRISDTFAADPSLGLLGGRDNVDGDRSSGDVGLPVGRIRRGKIIGNHHRGLGEFRYVQHVKGANMSMRRAQAQAVPLSFLVSGGGAQVRNEFVLSLAISAQGYRVAYDPRVQVDHFPARRAEGDLRVTIDPQRTFVRRANEGVAFIYAGRMTGWAAFALRAVLIGDRAAPGILLCLQASRGFSQLWYNVRGVVEGIRRGAAARTKYSKIVRR